MTTRHQHTATGHNARAESSRSYWLFGNHFTILADGNDTDGRYDLIDGRPPAGYQTPLHRHTRYSEQFYVVDGEFTIWIGERKVVLHPGESAFVPVGVAHVVAVTGDGPGHGLAIASPSGFARIIQEAGNPATGSTPQDSSPEDQELFFRLSAEIGDEVLGPPGMLPGD